MSLPDIVPIVVCLVLTAIVVVAWGLGDCEHSHDDTPIDWR